MEYLPKEPNHRTDLVAFVNERIEKLRDRLLDLSRRNPLIAMKLNERYNALIRIVDEQPENLLELLTSGSMEFLPLPRLDDDPKDEQSQEFQHALSEARIIDEDYINQLDEEGLANGRSTERFNIAERELKDRVREKLGLAPRQTREQLSIVKHAENNNIDPSYDLPGPNFNAEDDRYTDKLIQTLMLPDDMERRLNAIISKNRSWEQETGVAVLHAVFGVLEWCEVDGSNKSFAPLLVLPVHIEKKKYRSGYKYLISSTDEAPEINAAFSKKLDVDFGISMPPFEAGCSIEDYFDSIEEDLTDRKGWRVRRQVSIGVFPSQQIAMYEDLNTANTNFASNHIIDQMFGGSNSEGGLLQFAEDYDTEEHSFESSIPYIIADADSSQLSAIYDAVNGEKSIAIEGPPGSGKSQTIVNIIAAALEKGQKVLFVAEKTAALDVVRSRLNACGLGEFVLPLQVKKMAKIEVLDSLRDRLAIDERSNPEGLEQSRKRLQEKRNELRAYIDVLASEYENTGLTVHSILGRAIVARHKPAIKDFELASLVDNVSLALVENRDQFKDKASSYFHWYKDVGKQGGKWANITLDDSDPFVVDKILNMAKQSADGIDSVDAMLSDQINDGVVPSLHSADLRDVQNIFSTFAASQADINIEALEHLCLIENVAKTRSFADNCTLYNDRVAEIRKKTNAKQDSDLVESLSILEECLTDYSIPTASVNILNDRLAALLLKEEVCTASQSFMGRFLEMVKGSDKLCLASMVKFCGLVKVTEADTLDLRHQLLEISSNRKAVIEASIEGARIAGDHDSMGRIFNFEKVADSEDLNRILEVFRSAGIFAWLSPNFRKARKDYLRMASSSKASFDRSLAIINIEKLIVWRNEAQEYSENDLLKKILGGVFKDYRTDLKSLLDVVEFYSRLAKEFVTDSEEVLHSFIRLADTDRLHALPNPPVGDLSVEAPELTLEKLVVLQEEIQGNKSKFKSVIPKLSEALASSGVGEGLGRVKLGALKKSLQSNLLLKEQLNTSSEVRTILKTLFKGAETEPRTLDATIEYAVLLGGLSENHRFCVTRTLGQCNPEQYSRQIKAGVDEATRAEGYAQEVATIAGLSLESWTHDVKGRELCQFMKDASEDRSGLTANTRFVQAKSALGTGSEAETVRVLSEFCQDSNTFLRGLDQLLDLGLARLIYLRHGQDLNQYNGETLDKLRSIVKSEDKRIITLSRQLLRSKIAAKALVPIGNGRGPRSSWTEKSLLNNEMKKERRHIPIRSLTNRAGMALAALKPCWMMSPLAVSQYLPRGKVEFDLVIIDEASQMTPENAIGALTRAKRAVIVGDTNQLPPSNFFRKMFDEDDSDDAVVVEESILELANTAFPPVRRLRWHYRSRHSGLIAFSNHHVYNDELIIFPSPTERAKDRGVSLVQVDGIYASSINAIEAQAMVDYVEKFMTTSPDRSLGLVVLNQRQRDLISEQFEYRARGNSAISTYLENWEEARDGLEPFFIKNLENVQGDERDVILIGTVYGKEEGASKVAQRFGPINGIAGKRRLNVLFTRAREQIITFSSMSATDILITESPNAGKLLLRNWLEYSATGELPRIKFIGAETESEFEQHVASCINASGFRAVPQVGVAGFRIDLGIEHDQWPHGFIMGVECDGATYHSTKSARDRDRLRQELLESLGWQLYRIWSTDWFSNPVRENEKLISALKVRLEELLDGLAVEDISAANSSNGLEFHGDSVFEGTFGWEAILPDEEREESPSPSFSMKSITKIRPDAWICLADNIAAEGSLGISEERFIRGVAKLRGSDLPFSYRDGRHAFQVIEAAFEVGIPFPLD